MTPEIREMIRRAVMLRAEAHTMSVRGYPENLILGRIIEAAMLRAEARELLRTHPQIHSEVFYLDSTNMLRPSWNPDADPEYRVRIVPTDNPHFEIRGDWNHDPRKAWKNAWRWWRMR